MPDIDTHDLKVDFGKYKGERYTRIPVSYLRWMVNQRHSRKEIARAELERRNIALVDSPVEITGHSVDSASLRCWKLWKKTRSSSNVGLHAWLLTNVVDALSLGEPDKEGRITHNGMMLVLEQGELYWSLKTVMREKNK